MREYCGSASAVPGHCGSDAVKSVKSSRKAGDICPMCGAAVYEYRLTELHYLDGRVEPYDDPITSLLCDCGKTKKEPEQLSLFTLEV